MVLSTYNTTITEYNQTKRTKLTIIVVIASSLSSPYALKCPQLVLFAVAWL